EVEIRLGRGREAHFNLFEADFDQMLEKAQFALDAHGFDKRLVAIAQIGTHPYGWMFNFLAGPRAFREITFECLERDVFGSGVGDHDAPIWGNPGANRLELSSDAG